MRSVLLVLATILSAVASIPYIIEAYKGKAKPNLATWSTWTLLNAIIVIAALAAGDAINTVLLGAAFLLGSSTVLLIALFRGTRKYTLFDGICQAVALIGIILWQLTDNPNIALLFVILIDVAAFLPTARHAYNYPDEETWQTYALAGLGALLFTFLAKAPTFAAIAVTLESAIGALGLATLILLRRKTLK